MGKVPGYKIPSAIRTGTATGDNLVGKKVKNGVTVMAIAAGNVLVFAATFSADSPDSGDFVSARALLAAGAEAPTQAARLEHDPAGQLAELAASTS